MEFTNINKQPELVTTKSNTNSRLKANITAKHVKNLVILGFYLALANISLLDNVEDLLASQPTS